jgi:hypothetical protein
MTSSGRTRPTPSSRLRAVPSSFPPSRPLTVTGSFAAVRLAPVAAPALLCAYVDDPPTVARALGLIPTDVGTNVALLRPFDRVVWDRTVRQDGLLYVATSQIAIDCLTGNGRMPAEGEAVVDWMLSHEEAWRADSSERTAS